MALELTSLVFKTETSDLERASKVIGELVTNVGKLDKAARDAAQTEATLARAAKDNAKANLDNAKAQDVRLKSTITADKADQQATAAIEKKTKATEKVNEVVNKNVGVLQRQKDILEFQTQGFSKGQSSILAYGKAAGLAAEDIGELGKVLETQRKLMGGDPFDKSLSGLKSLQNQYTELKESVRQYATDSNLTAKQTRELARDKERLIEKMKVEGASFSEIRKAVRAHNTDYVNLATSYNKMTSAEDAVIKSRKEAVNATNYLTQADQKMAAALNTSNAALDKAGTDSLVKYETALRKSGSSQDVATLKLAKYKAQLEQVQIQEQKRREQHLTRALAPQATDVVVSLWSGQNPLTVLLQQGGQVTDLFMQSGVAAEKFGEVVKSSMQSMLPSILAVVKGVGGLLVDGLIAAGNATQGFIAGIFGMTGAMDKFYMKLSENGPSKFGGMIQAASSIMTGVFAVGVGVVITGLAMMAKGAYDSMIAVSDLNKAMVLGGNAFNMTGAQALAYADTLSGANASTLGIIEVMTEMSKVGGFTASQIELVSKAAISMQDYAGVAIKDTVKQFSELGKDPVKALLELAKKTGELTVEQIKSVEQLQKQGRAQDAVNLAMKLNAGVMDKQTQSLKDQLHPLEKLVAGWKILGRWMWNVTNIAPGTSDALELLNKKERLAKSLAAGVSENVPENVALKQEIALLEAKTLTQAQSAANRQAVKDEAAAYQQYSGALSEFDKQLNKADASKMKRQDFINAKIQELGVLENAGKYESTTLNTDRIKQFFKVYGEEWDKAQEKLGSKEANYFATLMREATNNTIAANTAAQELTKSEQKLLEVRSDPRFEKLTATQKQDVISKYEAAIAAEKQTSLTEKLAEAEEHRLKLLGKSEGIGKQYYSDMQKLEEFAKVAGWSRSEVEELTRAVFMATPAWKAYEKALEEVNSAARKFNEDSLASQASTVKENQSLDYRLSLLGKTTEEQRALSIEYNRANKISEVRIKLAKQLREIEEKIAKAKKDGLPESDYQPLIDDQVQARKDAAEQEKAINREVAVQYAEDFQKEFDAIKNGISDSIVTALFEGGKAGSKKFRDLVMAELRKPVTMVVNAVVNTVLGNIIGNLMGGTAGGAAGGIAGSALSSIGGSMIGNTVMSGIGSMGGVVGTAYNTALGTSLGLGSSSAAAAAQAASMAGGTSATSASLGSTLGAAMPWIAGAAALYSIISSFDDSGTYHTGGAANYSAATGLRTSLGFRDNEEGLPSYNPKDNIDNQFGTGFGYVEAGKETISAMGTLSKSLTTIFDGIAKSFGQTVGYEVSTAFADDTSEDGAWGALKIALNGQDVLNWNDFRQSKWAPKEFGDGEEGYKQYLAAVAKDSQKILMDSLSGVTWAKDILAAIGDSPSIEQLSTAVQEIATLQAVFEALKRNVEGFGNLSDEVLSKLVKSFGGAGNLTNAVNQFYTDFYTEAEKTANVMSYLTSEFNKQNLVLPKTREDYRKLVESQDLNTESGRELYTTLMTLAPAFASVVASTDGITQELKNNAVTLQIEKLRLLGQEEKALAMERDIAIKGLTDYQIAMWDANKTAQAYNQSLSSVNSLIPTVLKKFLSEDEWTKHQTNEVANSLVKSNVAFKDITSAVNWLTAATKEQIEVDTRALFDMQGLTIDQKKVLLESASIMADLKDTSSKVAEDIKKAFTKAGDDIVAYIKELTVGRAGLATPMELLDKTRQVYTQDFAAANAGDSDAAGRLVQSAKAYIDAQKTVTASSSFTNDVIKTIIGQLSGLGFVKEQLMASNAPFIPQFANGGTFDSGIVSKPTLFNIGQMGEAGPEAIMPLSRTSSGGLGVTTDNSSTNRLIAQLIVEVKALREQQSQETAGIISTNISVTEGTAQAVVDKLNEKDRQVNSQPTLN